MLATKLSVRKTSSIRTLILDGMFITLFLLIFLLMSGLPASAYEGVGNERVSAGANHSVSIKSDGTLFSWGRNDYGQLGLGDTTSRNTPTQVGTDNKWVSVSAGGYHSLAIKSDGTLFSWGWNEYGELGLGDTTSRNAPAQVGVDNKWVSVSGGGYHTLAIKSDGTLFSWGFNNLGELGLGDNVDRNTPTQVGVDNKWVSVSGGEYHTLAIKSDGILWAWGRNEYGQLGLGDTTDRSSPVKCMNLEVGGRSTLNIFYDYGASTSGVWTMSSTGTAFTAPAFIWNSGAGNWDAARSKPMLDAGGNIVIFYDYGGAMSGVWLMRKNGDTYDAPAFIWNSGAGNWDAARSKPIISDYDGDNDADIVIFYDYGGATSGVWGMHNGAGTYASPVLMWNSGSGNWDASRSSIFTSP